MDDRRHWRLGPLRDRCARRSRMDPGRKPMGRTVGFAADRADRRRQIRLLAPSWPRPSPRAGRDRLSRQFRCAQARRLHRRRCGLRGRLAQRIIGARHVRRGRPVRRSHRRSCRQLLWKRSRRARLARGPRLQPPFGAGCGCCGKRGRKGRARRHLSGDRRPAILDPRRKPALPRLGLRCDRHDRNARGQARTRSRASLRVGRDGHRL